jgi:hypothetical protein
MVGEMQETQGTFLLSVRREKHVERDRIQETSCILAYMSCITRGHYLTKSFSWNTLKPKLCTYPLSRYGQRVVRSWRRAISLSSFIATLTAANAFHHGDSVYRRDFTLDAQHHNDNLIPAGKMWHHCDRGRVGRRSGPRDQWCGFDGDERRPSPTNHRSVTSTGNETRS